MTEQENHNTAIKSRPRLSIKLLTLIPIFVLSFVCIISNIVAVHNIQASTAPPAPSRTTT